MTDVLAVRDVSVVHEGRRLLDVPALRITAGSHVAVMGPNGAGKSTLLRVLALLERPSAGTVLFRDVPVAWERGRLLALRRRLAVVLQVPPLCDTTVYRNVAMGLRFRGVGGRAADTRVRTWLERFGIADLGDRPARSLSGGEAQRTCLARAFVLDPEVLLLDEPFAALDEPTRAALLNDLESILCEARTSVVTVTHDREEAARLADTLVVLVGGTLRAVGPKQALLLQPPNRETAELFGFTVLPGPAGLLAVPSSGLALGPGPATFQLTVHRVIDMGYRRRVVGAINGTPIELDLAAGPPAPSPGERVTVSASGAVALP